MLKLKDATFINLMSKRSLLLSFENDVSLKYKHY